MRRVFAGLLITVAVLTAQAEVRVFRSISELATATRDDYRRAQRFELTAQVISKRGTTVTLHDGVAGDTFRNRQDHPLPFESGDIVHVKGRLESGAGSWLFLNLREVSVIGHRPLPPIRKLNGSEINDTTCRHQRVKCHGVLTSCVPDDIDPRYTWLTLTTPSGSFMTSVATNEWSHRSLTNLLDSEMEVTGIAVPFEGWRTSLGQFITPESPNGIRILRPAPADPFAAPEFNRTDSQHRRKATGRVIAVGNDRFYMKTAEYPLVQIIPAGSEPMPRTGDSVETVGFIRKSPFNPILSGALTRPADDPSSTPKNTQLPASPLPFEEKLLDKANTRLNGRIIRATGIIDRMNQKPGSGFTLDADGTAFTVETQSIDISPLRLEPKSKVAVTGLCIMKFSSSYFQEEFPHFDHFVLIPRTVEDIAVTEHPPWWTPLRLTIALVGMFIVLIGILIWNQTLRIRSEHRARELVRERLERTKTEGKIEERTRLAVELHDTISQLLTGVAMQLDSAIRAGKEGKTSSHGFLATAKLMLGSCRKELQDCLWELRSRTFAERDLTEAIGRALAPHVDNAQLDVRFNVPRQDISESTVHAILSIVRELCVNAIRHGHARHMQVAGESHDGTISFSVRDDGCGFSPDEAEGPKSGHFGLSGIRERLNAFDGKLEIESAPARGCRARVRMNTQPVDQA